MNYTQHAGNTPHPGPVYSPAPSAYSVHSSNRNERLPAGSLADYQGPIPGWDEEPLAFIERHALRSNNGSPALAPAGSYSPSGRAGSPANAFGAKYNGNFGGGYDQMPPQAFPGGYAGSHTGIPISTQGPGGYSPSRGPGFSLDGVGHSYDQMLPQAFPGGYAGSGVPPDRFGSVRSSRSARSGSMHQRQRSSSFSDLKSLNSPDALRKYGSPTMQPLYNGGGSGFNLPASPSPLGQDTMASPAPSIARSRAPSQNLRTQMPRERTQSHALIASPDDYALVPSLSRMTLNEEPSKQREHRHRHHSSSKHDRSSSKDRSSANHDRSLSKDISSSKHRSSSKHHGSSSRRDHSVEHRSSSRNHDGSGSITVFSRHRRQRSASFSGITMPPAQMPHLSIPDGVVGKVKITNERRPTKHGMAEKWTMEWDQQKKKKSALDKLKGMGKKY